MYVIYKSHIRAYTGIILALKRGAFMPHILFARGVVVDLIVSANDPFKCQGLAIMRETYCNQRVDFKDLIATIIVFYHRLA